MSHAEKQESMNPYTRKKEGSRKYLQKPSDIGSNKAFKVAIINMFMKRKKTVIKEAKESMMTPLY